MRHTSGIPEYFRLLEERSISLEMESTREDALGALRGVDMLCFEPGSAWEYSNSNYLLLGPVIEAAADAPLRTGAPAGPWLNDRRLADAAPGAPEDSRYGAGR